MQGTYDHGGLSNSEPGPLCFYCLWCTWLILSSQSQDWGRLQPHCKLLTLAIGHQIERPALDVLVISFAFAARDCKSRPAMLVIAVPHSKPFWIYMGLGVGMWRADDYCGLRPSRRSNKHCSNPGQKVAFFFILFLAQESYHASGCTPPKPCHSSAD